jgi:hypothetical protein
MQPRVKRFVDPPRRAASTGWTARRANSSPPTPTSTWPPPRAAASTSRSPTRSRRAAPAHPLHRGSEGPEMALRGGPERARAREPGDHQQHRVLLGLGSTYPFNPYPFPWVNHLFQDAPSIAIGIFEGHMRKMADAFVEVRRAEKLLAGEYDEADGRAFFEAFDWKQFTDEEFHLCPPVLTIGGDGAMLDIGFQNLSRLLASGKPIRVMVLDTQVYSNTGGQASTGTFTGQAADMSPFGKVHPGQGGGAQGARADRPRAPRHLRAAELAGLRLAPDRRRDPRAEQPAAGHLQHLHAVPGGARAPRRVGAARRQAGAGEPRLPLPGLRSGRRRLHRRLPLPGRQPGRGRQLADLHPGVHRRSGRERRRWSFRSPSPTGPPPRRASRSTSAR